MNDVLLTDFILPSPPVSHPPTGPAKGPRPDNRSGASFADIVGAATGKLRQKKDPGIPEKPRKNVSETPEEDAAAMSAVNQPQTPNIQTAPQAEDATETGEVSPDMDVNRFSAIPGQAAPANELADFAQPLIKNRDGGNLTDRVDPTPVIFGGAAAEEAAALAEYAPVMPADAAPPEGMEALASLLGQTAEEPAEEMYGALKQGIETRARLMKTTDRTRADTVSDAVPSTPAAEADIPRPVPDGTMIDARQDGGGEESAEDGAEAFAPPAEPKASRPEADGRLRPLSFAEVRHAAPAETVDIPETRPQPANAAQIIRQVVEAAALKQSGTLSELTVQLNPEFLGRVNIVISATAQGLNARIQSESDTVRGLLAAHVGELKAALRDMGLDMKNIDIGKGEMARENAFGGHGHPEGRGEGREYGAPDGDRRVIPLTRFQTARAQTLIYDAQLLPADGGEAAGVDLMA